MHGSNKGPPEQETASLQGVLFHVPISPLPYSTMYFKRTSSLHSWSQSVLALFGGSTDKVQQLEVSQGIFGFMQGSQGQVERRATIMCSLCVQSLQPYFLEGTRNGH